MYFSRVRIGAARESQRDIAAFYSGVLGLAVSHGPEAVVAAVGETRVEFVERAGGPFHHFAFLVPGDRFDASLAWARARLDILPDRESGELVFEFDNWEARALYFSDPVGNIVELIAHSPLERHGTTGPFDGAELCGVSEIGLVGETRDAAAALERDLGLEVWAGSLEPQALAFVGERGRTLILAPVGRPWLPTNRAAESHPVEVEVAGAGVTRTIRLTDGHSVVATS